MLDWSNTNVRHGSRAYRGLHEDVVRFLRFGVWNTRQDPLLWSIA